MPKIKIKKRYFNYFLIRYKDTIVLQKRQKKDIWQNLYELLLIDFLEEQDWHTIDFKAVLNKQSVHVKTSPQLVFQTVHKLTHQHLYINFWEAESVSKPDNCVSINKLHQYPMPIVIANFLDNNL